MTRDAVLVQYLYWVGRWKWDYSIKGKEYTWDDAVRPRLAYVHHEPSASVARTLRMVMLEPCLQLTAEHVATNLQASAVP